MIEKFLLKIKKFIKKIQFIVIFQKFFFSQESSFLSVISFFLISLISLNFIFYLNLFTFSDAWIENESRVVTLQISPLDEEKQISNELKSKILVYLEKKKLFSSIDFLSENEIIDFLGLSDLHRLSNIRIPLFIKTEFRQNIDLDSFDDIKEIINNRLYKLVSHKNEIREIINFISKIKLFIFLIGLIIFTLFIFFLSKIIKASLVANFKFLELVQIMGAGSKQISYNVSFILIRKIFPGIILGVLFSLIISLGITNLFNIPLNFSNEFLKIENYLVIILYLISFILLTLFIIFFILSVIIYNFLEKRFFAKY